VLASSAVIKEIKTIQKSGPASLAMYDYDFREDKKKGLHGILSSILFQLCGQSDSYHSILSTFYSIHLDGAQRPSDDKLIHCLIDLSKLSGSQPIYLIVDALDKCPSTSSLSSPCTKLLLLLEDLVKAQLPNLRICVTSQPEIDIKVILEPLAFLSVSLHNTSGQQKDIKDYIVSVINTNKKIQDWNSQHKQLVVDALTRKAGRM